MTPFRRNLPFVALALATSTTAQVVINEIRIDQPSSDNDEFFELAGPAGTDLSALTYIVIGDQTGAGTGGGVDTVIPLSGFSINAAGFFLGVEDTWTGSAGSATPDYIDSNPFGTVGDINFENNDNNTHMLVTGFTGSIGDDVDTDDDGVIDNVLWTSIVDLIALQATDPLVAGDLLYGPPTIGPDGTFMPAHVFRSPDGTGSLDSWNMGDFGSFTYDTAGASNAAAEISAASGGQQVLILNGGAAHAGDIYLILGGASGTSPGFPVSGTVTLALNYPDALVDYSLANAGGAIFSNTFGLLDGNGQAFASVNMPTLPVGQIGTAFNMAGVVWDVGTFTAELGTNATGTVTIIP